MKRAGVRRSHLESSCAQPYGYRICHKDEKNASAILMRILQISRQERRHPPYGLRTYRSVGSQTSLRILKVDCGVVADPQ